MCDVQLHFRETAVEDIYWVFWGNLKADYTLANSFEWKEKSCPQVPGLIVTLLLTRMLLGWPERFYVTLLSSLMNLLPARLLTWFAILWYHLGDVTTFSGSQSMVLTLKWACNIFKQYCYVSPLPEAIHLSHTAYEKDQETHTSWSPASASALLSLPRSFSWHSQIIQLFKFPQAHVILNLDVPIIFENLHEGKIKFL